MCLLHVALHTARVMRVRHVFFAKRLTFLERRGQGCVRTRKVWHL